ncbi:MAG TPA: uracil-DNA glycosylase [Woeseiaceae bacterium]
MNNSERLAYLEALGVDVFAFRSRQSVAESAIEVRESSPAPADIRLLAWPELQQAVASCTRCALHQSRTQTVFGVGNQQAEWMIIGEAPGAEEDQRGEPFVGRAGKLLDEMLRAVNLSRDSVFICNILKCRPPGNRDPAAVEAAACRDYLERQIELVSPRLILAVGRIAAQQLLGSDAPLARLRGTPHRLTEAGIPLIVTYHPAYLLRKPTEKRKAWQDLCLAQQVMRERAA